MRIIDIHAHVYPKVAGITNGAPLLFRTAIKPTPSIFKQQKTISLTENKNDLLTIHGRHDPCIAHRAAPVVDAVTALVLCDMLTVDFGAHCFTPYGLKYHLDSDGAMVFD